MIDSSVLDLALAQDSAIDLALRPLPVASPYAHLIAIGVGAGTIDCTVTTTNPVILWDSETGVFQSNRENTLTSFNFSAPATLVIASKSLTTVATQLDLSGTFTDTSMTSRLTAAVNITPT